MESSRSFSDAMNALMALPNLIGLALPSGIWVRNIQDFTQDVLECSIHKLD